MESNVEIKNQMRGCSSWRFMILNSLILTSVYCLDGGEPWTIVEKDSQITVANNFITFLLLKTIYVAK